MTITIVFLLRPTKGQFRIESAYFSVGNHQWSLRVRIDFQRMTVFNIIHCGKVIITFPSSVIKTNRGNLLDIHPTTANLNLVIYFWKLHWMRSVLSPESTRRKCDQKLLVSERYLAGVTRDTQYKSPLVCELGYKYWTKETSTIDIHTSITSVPLDASMKALLGRSCPNTLAP